MTVPDLPREVSLAIKAKQGDGAVLGTAVSRSSKTKLYLGLSNLLYNMNLPHAVRVPVGGYTVDIAFPGKRTRGKELYWDCHRRVRRCESLCEVTKFLCFCVHAASRPVCRV